MNPILPLEVIILMFLALVPLGTFVAWRSGSSCGLRSRGGIAAARFCALSMLLVPLINPGFWSARPVEARDAWLVLVDSSTSMRVGDGAQGTQRWAQAADIAGQLEQAADSVEVVTFADRLGEGIANTQPDGPSTDIANSIKSAIERYRSGNPRLRGVFVISDGRQVGSADLASVTREAIALAVPIHAIPLGGQVVQPDVAVHPVQRQVTAFAGQTIQVAARVTAEGTGNIEAMVELYDSAGAVVGEKEVPVAEGGDAVVRFDLPSLAAGQHTVRFEVKPTEGELRTANNTASCGINVLSDPVRVLLVEGSPYWDTKFIAQLLQQDRNFDFEVVYRLTSDRFFGVGADIGASTEPKAVTTTAFPEKIEDLARYDLVVFGDSVEYFLNSEKVATLREWIQRRGGALILARGNPVTTEVPGLDELLPTSWDAEWNRPFRWQPTLAGDDSGLFGTALPGSTDPIWDSMPELASATYGTEAKPFSVVLAEGISETGGREARFPVVVSRRIGDGLSVSVNSDDLWRWDFFPKFEGANEIYRTFWPQLFNWALAYTDFLPGQNLALKFSRQLVDPGQPIRVRVLRRSGSVPDFKPLLQVRRGPDPVESITPAALPDQADVWETLITLSDPGLHKVQLVDSAAGGEDSRVVLTSFIEVNRLPSEDDNLSADPAFLDKLARSSTGRTIGVQEAVAMVQTKEDPDRPIEGNADWNPIWISGWFLFPFLGFFAAEWIIRRKNGLV